MVEGCRLAGYDDILLMLAKIHDLDYYFNFRFVLVKAYDLLGLQPAEKKKSSAPAKSKPAPKPTSTKTGTAKTHDRVRRIPAADDGELASLVYGRIMELCPLESRDRSYLRSRGVSLETIRDGRFGSMTPARVRKVKATLQSEFGREVLLRVPGFSEDERHGHLKFTLTGNYLLIPYHDRYGRISTIEGRSVGEVNGRMGKYVSLRDAGNHLYVFPGHGLEELQAVCEGVMGAIAAAESGLSVGSIQGCQRFRSRIQVGESGASYAPLPELRGVDFGGRTVPYIPDADDPPNPTVLHAAPKAARWVAEPQSGKPAICLLPLGKDLDEWLLSIKPEERESRFTELLANASPPEDGVWIGSDSRASREGKPEHEAKSESQPPATISKGTRRLRSEVYGKLLEILSLKDEHIKAFSELGVWSATLRAGRFVSLDEDLAKKAASELVRRFGAKKLCVVPGFEFDGGGAVLMPLAESGEFVLAPCFDAEGAIFGLQATPYDTDAGKMLPDRSIPLAEGEEYLYIFAPYDPGSIVSICDGMLGTLLAAQEDVVIGATVFWRDGKACVDLEERTSQLRFQQMEDVDFEGGEVFYLSQAKDTDLREQDTREVKQLIVRLNGRPVVKEFPSDGVGKSNISASLGEWMLPGSEDIAGRRLRDLLQIESDEPSVKVEEDQSRQDRTDRISPGITYCIVLASALLAALLDSAILRVQTFAEFVSVGAGGEQILYDGRIGFVREMLDSPPMSLLYEFREPASLLFGITLTTGLLVHRRRGSAARSRKPPGAYLPISPGDVLLAAAVWLSVATISKFAMSLVEYLVDIFSLQSSDVYVEIPGVDASLLIFAVATCAAGFVLWRRIFLGAAQARMLRGEIRH